MARSQDYYTTVYNTAKSLGANDVQAHLAASQASLETGYGRSVKGNNHFGIKAGSSYAGPTTTFGTHEFRGGKRVNQSDTFRAYEGLPQSVAGYMSFMSRTFPDAWNAPTVKEATTNLDKGRYGSYATDPKYEQKVASIANRFGSGVGVSLPSEAPIPTARPDTAMLANADQLPVIDRSQPPVFASLMPTQRAPASAFDQVLTAPTERPQDRMALPYTPDAPHYAPASMPSLALSAVPPSPEPPVTAPAGRRTVYPEGQPVAISKPHVEGVEIGPKGIESPLLEPPSPFRPDNLPQHYQGPKGLGGPGGLYPGGVPAGPMMMAPMEEPVPVQPAAERTGRLSAPSPLPNEQFNERFGTPPEPPLVPSGMHAISGLFAAPSGATAASRSNPDITFRSLGDGRVERTNQYGATATLNAGDYAHPMTPDPSGMQSRTDSLPSTPGIAGPAGQQGIEPPERNGFMGIDQPSTRLGQTVRGGLGGGLGAGMGGLLGPAGALIGGLIGREMAMGRNPLQAFSAGPLQTNAFGGRGTGYFPAAPVVPVQMGGANNNTPSYADMAAISPAAASAIASGRGGLY